MKAYPIDGPSSFGDDFGPSHAGIDIFADAGTPILAVDAGSVRSSFESRGGNVIYLRTPDGVTYYYAHLQSYVGKFPRIVRAGETIGRVGTTGNAEFTEPHIHFELHRNGEIYNPYNALSSAFDRGPTRWPLILGISAVATATYYLLSRL